MHLGCTCRKSLQASHSFLCVPKEKNPPCGLRHTAKQRAATSLRQPRSPRLGTGGAKTRCAQTVCPFIRPRPSPPGSVTMAPTPNHLPSKGKTAVKFVGLAKKKPPPGKEAAFLVQLQQQAANLSAPGAPGFTPNTPGQSSASGAPVRRRPRAAGRRRKRR